MDHIRLKGHFHIVYILKIIRYGLILCLVPMVQALLDFDLNSLYRALRQDAAILVGMAVLGTVLWRRVGFALTDKALVLDTGVLCADSWPLPGGTWRCWSRRGRCGCGWRGPAG